MQLDTSILDMLHDLSAPGEPSALLEILDVFEEDGRQVLSRLQEATREGNAEATRRLAHRLKGASANVGASGLAEQLEAIERAAPGGITAALQERVAAIEPTLETTLTRLRAYDPKRSR